MAKRRGNNEGSIYRRKDGYWVGQYGVQTAEGTKTRYLYGKRREDVREKLTKAIADRDGGLVYDAGNITVGSTWTVGSTTPCGIRCAREPGNATSSS
jgi:hypothetical protein